MVRQHRLDGAAQQRRVVARHGRHDQQFGIAIVRVLDLALEMDQIAKWALPDHLFVYGHADTADERVRKCEYRFAIAAGRALENFTTGHDPTAIGRVAQRVERVFVV